MSKYKVILYFSFGPVVATEDEEPFGKPLLFDSLDEAESYGRTKNMPFEAVENTER